MLGVPCDDTSRRRVHMLCAAGCAEDAVLDSKYAYIVVPHTIQPKIETDFVLRLFSETEVGCCLIAVVTLAPLTAASCFALVVAAERCHCSRPFRASSEGHLDAGDQRVFGTCLFSVCLWPAVAVTSCWFVTFQWPAPCRRT